MCMNSSSNRWRWRADDAIRHGHVSIPTTIALLALQSTATVGLEVAGASGVTLHIAREVRVARRSFPGRHTPHHASERLELDAFALPATTRLARAVECA